MNKLLSGCKALNKQVQDEMYIITNDFKRLFPKYDEDTTRDDFENVYGKDEHRKEIVRNVKVPDLEKEMSKDGMSENVERLVKYCFVFDAMVEIVSEKLNKTADVWRSGYGNKVDVLVMMVLIMYTHGGGDGGEDDEDDNAEYMNEHLDIGNYLNELDEYMLPSDGYEGDVNMIEFLQNSIRECESNEGKFVLREFDSFVEALKLINQSSSNVKRIDVNLLLKVVGGGCDDVISSILTNSLLCSIYLHNRKCEWFDESEFRNYLQRSDCGENMLELLGEIVLSRRDYNVLYALCVVCEFQRCYVSGCDGVGYEHVNNHMNNHMNSNEICDETFMKRNRAIYITLNCSRKRDLVIELQTDKELGGTPSYVVYDISCSNEYNILRIFYSTNELIKGINALGGGEVGCSNMKLHGSGRDDTTFDMKFHLMYLLVVLLVIALCSVVGFHLMTMSKLPEMNDVKNMS